MPLVSLLSSLPTVSHLPTLTPRFPNTLVLLSRVRSSMPLFVERASLLKGEYRLLKVQNRFLAFGRVSLADRQMK